MPAASTKVLEEAMKLPVNERVRVAEELLASADAEGFEDESEAAVNAAWAEEIERRSREMRDGSVRGLSIEEARHIVSSDSGDER
jgi:putative addiction module component (TIGR02574 family)